MTTSAQIRHEPDRQRFVTTIDGIEAVLDYRMDGDFIELTHTVVPEPIGGRGVAGQLTRAAFEHAREQGLSVRPSCSYAAAWVQRHPEFSQLLA